VDVIKVGFHGNALAAGFLKKSMDNLFQSVTNFAAKNLPAVFHAPNEVIGQQMNRVRAGIGRVTHLIRTMANSSAP
jgi:hypothetical protein